nr:uncharacterized protein LOC111422885 [Onthophagus taurus]
MSYISLLTILFALNGIALVHPYKICNNPTPSPYYSEVECVTTKWFVYGGSNDCTDCCITRNMTVIEPGKIIVTDTTIKNGVTTSETYKATSFGADPIYYKENDDYPKVIVSTDCKTFCVIYDFKTGDIHTFTNKVHQKRNFQKNLDGIQKCGIEVYDYNPGKTCKGVDVFQ